MQSNQTDPLTKHNTAPAANGEVDTFDEALLANLNPEQRRAVTTTEGPLLVLAGAGSGKTRVITSRVAWLVKHKGIHPAQILAITFTNKAANEMKDRITSLIGLSARGAWIGTFHSMMLRILRRHADLLGYRSQFAIFDISDQERVMRDVLEELNISKRTLTPREALNRIGSFKNKGMKPSEVKKSSSYIASDLARIYERYQKTLFERNAMDFDDILLQTLRLFAEQPHISAQYQHQFRYVLVDEYQDTNRVQYDLVLQLSAKHKNLCVVGDDDQSIYAFRGADVQNILDFEKDFSDATVIRLEQNYRSTSVILAAANNIIQENTARKHKRLWTAIDGGEPIMIYSADDHFDEARFVARDIARKLEAENKPKGLSFAVLYRMNALSRNIEYALRESNINYHIYGGTRFYDRREIKDVTAYLRLIMTPEDDVAFRRAVQVPRRGIGEVSIERINALAGENDVSMLEISRNASAYEELSRVAGRAMGFAQLIAELRARLEQAEDDMTLADFIRLVEHRSGMISALQEEAERGNAEAPSRLENLKELLSDALEFEANLLREDEEGAFEDPFYQEEEQELTPLTILQNFLERTALYTDQDTEDEEPLVSLMTVHSAKGLEFDIVYLVGAEEGIFPSSRCFENPDGLEEERRLAYVAVTRAKKELLVTTATNRLLFGSTQYNIPSRFIESIPEDLVQRRGTAPQKRDYSSAARVQTDRNLFASVVGSERSERIEHSSEQAGGIDPKELSVGDKIRHASRGVGEIRKINIVGGDAILTIDFDGETRRFMASQSFLTKE